MKILITGATNGMGKGVAKVLNGDNQNNEIIILCRSKERGEQTIKEFEEESKNKNTSIVICDLAKLDEVKNAVQEIHEKHQYLDAIFINAGLGYAKERIETQDKLNPHFQVNFLSQFYLTLNLLELLEKSEMGGRVIFNSTIQKPSKDIGFWEDMQMEKKWGFEESIFQNMLFKRMFCVRLHEIHRKKNSKISFVGFSIHKTVWTNQLQIIPKGMKFMASVAKLLGSFISIEKCGEIMKPLFTEKIEESLKRSGTLIQDKGKKFRELKENPIMQNKEKHEFLWKYCLDLLKDEKTNEIVKHLNEGTTEKEVIEEKTGE